MDYNKDYYKIMGLSKTASDEEIKLAYRRLARKYHPDLNKAEDAEAKFKELGEAYEILKDPQKRREYDQGDQANVFTGGAPGGESPYWHNMGGAGFQNDVELDADFFESLFGAKHQRQRGPRKGADLRSRITISLEDAYHGAEKDLQLPTHTGTGQKYQTVRVKIPAGIKQEQQIRLTGKGEPGDPGQPNGDLYLTIHIQKHPFYDVMENDIYMTLPIAPWEAALGTTIQVPTLGGKVDLKVPAGSQGGQTLRLKKRGLKGEQAGDQYIILKIIIPQPANEEDRQLYQTMSEKMAFNPRKQMGGA
jgi:curved DNA-binding protein